MGGRPDGDALAASIEVNVLRLHTHSAICRQVAKHLEEELDSSLHRRSCREIRKHLGRCRNCTAYLDSLRKTVLLYRRYPDPHLPTQMREKLFAILKLPL